MGNRLPAPSSAATARLQAALQAEADASGDLELLGVVDGGKARLSEKSLAWFLRAAEVFAGARFVGKADVDTFLVVPRVLAFLRRAPADVPLILGRHQFASYSYRHSNICGCCGFTRTMAVNLARRQHKPPWACNHSRTETAVSAPMAPFPFGIGPFFALSHHVVDWVRASPLVRRATADLAAARSVRLVHYAEDIFISWLASHTPRIQALGLSFMGRAVHDIDEQVALMKAECQARLELNKTAFLNGFRSRNGNERTSPATVAVHHVLSEAAWNRTWAATSAWTSFLKGKPQSEKSCIFEMLPPPE